jgi:PAS domain S-box-containing protein
MRAILETALDAVIGMDHRGVVTDFNPAAERMFGYAARDAVGQELADLLIPTHLQSQHRDGLRRYLTTGEGPFIDRRVETIGHHADGHEFPVEVAITRVSGEHPPRFTGFVRDLTARAQAEREREQLLQRELTARREAELASRAKDEFLATLSHELRTPLNAVLGWARILRSTSMPAATQARALEAIERNAQLQAGLIEDLLEVSRIASGKMRLDTRPCDLASIVDAAVEVVGPAAAAKNVVIGVNIDTRPSMTKGDPDRLQQVVWNLLLNAVKFTPDGGRIDVRLTGDRGYVLTVSDTGIGIDATFLPYIFQPFSQADAAANREHGGLGLGMTIVRQLVELHGGTVSARSAGVGKGATFEVRLPSMLDAGEALPPPARQMREMREPLAEEPFLRDLRVLVVDDQEDARDLIRTTLESHGASVATACSAAEALEALDIEVPDVLVSDIGMSGEDGYALMERIRGRSEDAGGTVPAVALTAYASQADRDKALAAGYDAHLAKPAEPSDIAALVFRVARRRRTA